MSNVIKIRLNKAQGSYRKNRPFRLLAVLIRCTPEERREPAGQRCAYARRCPAGVAAPPGCVIFFASAEIAACTPYSRYFFRFSRRSSLCCSCANLISARSFSARSCSRVFGFVIALDLPF